MVKVAEVSILMNGYNSDLYLKEAIDSVYAQTYTDWEIVFIDNCSTDSTREIVSKYDKKTRYYRTHTNVPLGKARNFGLQYCTGNYIAFLDCDDLFVMDKLEKQILAMQGGDFSMCYGSFVVIDESGKRIRKSIVQNKSGNVLPGLLRRYEINMQTVMLKREFIVDNQLSFNTNMSYCPDHNLFMIVASKANVAVIPDILARYRVVKNSLSKRTINIAPKEYRMTIDELYKANSDLRERLSRDFDYAYNKAIYYEVVADIHNNNISQARHKLKGMISSRIEYFLLYCLLLMPVPNKIILRLLKR